MTNREKPLSMVELLRLERDKVFSAPSTYKISLERIYNYIMKYYILDYKDWNQWNHPEHCKTVAKKGDIFCCIDEVWFLLSRNNGENNIIMHRQFWPRDEHTAKDIILAGLSFVYILYTFFDIEYIKVKGKKNKYNFISRLFPSNCVLDPERDDDGEEVRYCHLTEEGIYQVYEILSSGNLYINK